jgi:hypothetical protein
MNYIKPEWRPVFVVSVSMNCFRLSSPSKRAEVDGDVF